MTLSGGNKLIDPNKLFDRIKIKQGERIADLGCGTSGHFVFPAAERVGDSGAVYAVDILKTVLKNIESIAKTDNRKNVQAIWSNVEKFDATKIDDESIDLVCLINILFQSKNHAGIMKEAVRLIRPMGRLLVVDWKQIATPFGPSLKERVTKESIISLAQAHGLRKVDDFDAGEYHYALVFQKI